MNEDPELLRAYAETGAEEAFGELVRRHLGLVYQSALRQLGDESHLAADVAQGVFLLLAGRARDLARHPCLVAWLHATTRYKASEVRRAELRRRRRETAAHLMHELTSGGDPPPDWETLRPLIDEVLHELGERDRAVVLWRYFESHPVAAIAARLQVSEAGAYKCLERAVERLRARLASRGVTSTAAALAGVLGTHAAGAAVPSGLAATVTGAALAAGLPVAAAGGAVSLMSLKTAVSSAAAALLLTAGLYTHQATGARAAADELAAREAENSALAARLRAVAAVAPAPPAPAVATAPPPAATSARPAAATASAGSRGVAGLEEGRAFLRAHPEVRAALAAYLRDTVESEYAELLRELGLTPAERERFLTVLAQARRHGIGGHQLTLAETEISGAELTQQLREVLGEARHERYRAFRDSAIQRDLTRELTQSLYFTPTPLTPAQAADLRQIVARAVADPSLGKKYTGGVWSHLPAPVWERIVADAGAVLAPSQVEAVRELQAQSQFWRAQTEAGRRYRAAQAAAQPPSP